MEADEGVRLKSGKSIYVHGGILGIAPDSSVTGGYDHDIISPPPNPFWANLTPDDVCELANIAIARWRRLKKIVRAA